MELLVFLSDKDLERMMKTRLSATHLQESPVERCWQSLGGADSATFHWTIPCSSISVGMEAYKVQIF